MKNIHTIAGVLFCITMFAASKGDEPTSFACASVIKSSASTFKIIYKSESLSDVRISILNSDNSVVFTEKVRNTMGFARPYSFENLRAGDYKVIIEDDKGTTEKLISTKQVITSRMVNVLKLRSAE